MNKQKANYWIDIGLGITFILASITGIVKWPGLSSHPARAGWPMAEIGFIHDWSGLIMSLLVLIHIILHWKWIIAMTKRIFRRKRGRK